MNETTPATGVSDGPLFTGDHRARVPDTSMLPGSEKAPAAAVGLLKDAAQGAHDRIDRMANAAAPAVRQLGEGVAAAADAIHAKADQLRDTRDEWVDGLRGTIRSKPLTCVATAFALGAVLARIAR